MPLEGSYTIGNPQARLEIEIGGLTAGTEYDQLSSTGTVDLGGVLDVLALDLGSYTPTAGDRFEIINSTSAILDTFNSVNFPSIGFGRALTWQQQFGLGVSAFAATQTVPEPATLLLAIVAAAALPRIARRAHRRAC